MLNVKCLNADAQVVTKMMVMIIVSILDHLWPVSWWPGSGLGLRWWWPRAGKLRENIFQNLFFLRNVIYIIKPLKFALVDLYLKGFNVFTFVSYPEQDFGAIKSESKLKSENKKENKKKKKSEQKIKPVDVEGPPPPDCWAIRETWKNDFKFDAIWFRGVFLFKSSLM